MLNHVWTSWKNHLPHRMKSNLTGRFFKFNLKPIAYILYLHVSVHSVHTSWIKFVPSEPLLRRYFVKTLDSFFPEMNTFIIFSVFLSVSDDENHDVCLFFVYWRTNKSFDVVSNQPWRFFSRNIILFPTIVFFSIVLPVLKRNSSCHFLFFNISLDVP